jgi:hypothetical protein
MAPFDPTAHPMLADLTTQLPELAGAAAFRDGKVYFAKGLVQQTTVSGTSAYATVKGSADYRVSVGFGDPVKVTCTCPAHRRNRYCKHVVALCTALVQAPGSFTVVEAPAEEPPKPEKRPRAPRAAKKGPQTAELRAAGLEVVDRLLAELADGGLLALGPDKVSLIAQAGELARALKLRRLGNLIVRLQDAVPAAGRGGGLDEATFARLLIELELTRRASATMLQGDGTLDPALAEDLLGKTWREDDLEPITNLDLVAVGFRTTRDREFVVETAYLADLGDGVIYAEKSITPARMWRSSAGVAPARVRLVVAEAGLYPGPAPRRIRLKRSERAPLTADHVRGLVARATADFGELPRRRGERLAVPVADAEVVALVRAERIGQDDGRFYAVDGRGAAIPLQLHIKGRAGVVTGPPDCLRSEGPIGIFGLVHADGGEVGLEVLSVIGDRLVGGGEPLVLVGP